MTQSIPNEGFIRLKQLIGAEADSVPIVPVSAATIWNWVRQGKFPKPVRLSPAITAWKVQDIRDFLESGGEL